MPAQPGSQQLLQFTWHESQLQVFLGGRGEVFISAFAELASHYCQVWHLYSGSWNQVLPILIAPAAKKKNVHTANFWLGTGGLKSFPYHLKYISHLWHVSEACGKTRQDPAGLGAHQTTLYFCTISQNRRCLTAHPILFLSLQNQKGPQSFVSSKASTAGKHLKLPSGNLMWSLLLRNYLKTVNLFL